VPSQGPPAAPAVQPWAAPAAEHLRDDDDLARALAALAAAAPAALGLVVLLSAPHPDLPREAAHDPRRLRAELLALAGEGRVYILHLANLTHLRPLQALLAGDGTRPPPYVILHDAHFGLTALAPLGVRPPRYGCTRVAATLLAEGAHERHDHAELHRLVPAHLQRGLPGEVSEGQVTPAIARYPVAAAAADCLVPLLKALTPSLRERGLSKVYDLECRLLPAVLEMESAGIGLDLPGFAAVVAGWQKEKDTGPAPERLAQLDKLLSTYGHWARDFAGEDGRLRPHLHPLATDSGRFACSQPNLQQVPAEHTAPGLRACFLPAPGTALIVADYAQIELRVAAELAPCEALRAVFRAGRDPHRATAATLARKPEAEVTAHERKLAKAVNFGFLFGMGARRFQEYALSNYGLQLDAAAAQAARDAFFATFPGIAAWHRRVGALAARGEREAIVVHTALGRRRRFAPGRFSFNAALNIPVQGTAADGFKRAMIDLHAALQPLGGRGILCVHDEYLAEVPEDRAEAARDLVQRTMEAAMATVVPHVPIVAEARIARSWAEK
jgi:DNA polymerase I-like protein with 3'-5' exonuclease and polymerase domains